MGISVIVLHTKPQRLSSFLSILSSALLCFCRHLPSRVNHSTSLSPPPPPTPSLNSFSFSFLRAQVIILPPSPSLTPRRLPLPLPLHLRQRIPRPNTRHRSRVAFSPTTRRSVPRRLHARARLGSGPRRCGWGGQDWERVGDDGEDLEGEVWVGVCVLVLLPFRNETQGSSGRTTRCGGFRTRVKCSRRRAALFGMRCCIHACCCSNEASSIDMVLAPLWCPVALPLGHITRQRRPPCAPAAYAGDLSLSLLPLPFSVPLLPAGQAVRLSHRPSLRHQKRSRCAPPSPALVPVHLLVPLDSGRLLLRCSKRKPRRLNVVRARAPVHARGLACPQ